MVREVLGPYICKSDTPRTPRRVEDNLEGREMKERSDKMDEMKGIIDIQQTWGKGEQNEKWSVDNGEERGESKWKEGSEEGKLRHLPQQEEHCKIMGVINRKRVLNVCKT